MSIHLETESGGNLRVNVWNWGVLHHVVSSAGLFPDAVWTPMRSNGGAALSREQVVALADFLEGQVLPMLKEGERMFFDGTVTNVPDDGTFYREENELWKNYSLHRNVLASIIAHLRAANGSVSVL
jgi:hypothetical protein